MTHEERASLPTSTTSNEALQNELNKAFKPVVRYHLSTVLLRLDLSRLKKLIEHDSARFRPTCSQVAPRYLLTWVVARDLSEDSFGHRLLIVFAEGLSPMDALRQLNIARIRKWLGEKGMTMKKKHVHIRRTVFTYERRYCMACTEGSGILWCRTSSPSA